MYVVTGGAGFIGSAIVAKLNSAGIENVIIVDDLGSDEKWKNLQRLTFQDILSKDNFLEQLLAGHFGREISAIIHMGACSTTTERDIDFLLSNNFHYTCRLIEHCAENSTRLIYASSASTYGQGEHGYDDDQLIIPRLRPQHGYGFSKQLVDQWVLRSGFYGSCVGLKFFNVFGPNEYHKVGQWSAAKWGFDQAQDTGEIKLFRSERPEYEDGGQLRDFIYVKDCLGPILWLIDHREVNGIFNLGTGKARSWKDLALAIFAALGLPPKITYIEMRPELRGQYQYFTEAKMDRLAATGCPLHFRSLEESVGDFIKRHLTQGDPYLGSDGV